MVSIPPAAVDLGTLPDLDTYVENENMNINASGMGLWGLLILIADIWAIVSVVSSSVTTGKKVLWVLLILILPVLGFIIWFFAGPRGK